MVDSVHAVIFVWVLGLSFLFLLLGIPFDRGAAEGDRAEPALGRRDLRTDGAGLPEGIPAQTVPASRQTPTIEAWVPIFLFCVLFGLSMDYHVFLLSRIREHYDQTHKNRESVAVGLQSTARLITGAALIMVVVFAGSPPVSWSPSSRWALGWRWPCCSTPPWFARCWCRRSWRCSATSTGICRRGCSWLPDLRIEGEVARPVSPAPRTGLLSPGDD